MTQAAPVQPTPAAAPPPAPTLAERSPTVAEDLAAVDDRANALLERFRAERDTDEASDEPAAAKAKGKDATEDERRARRDAAKAKAKDGEADDDEPAEDGAQLAPSTERATEDAQKARDAALERAATIERENVRARAHIDALKKQLGERESTLKQREESLAARERAFEEPDQLLKLLEDKVGADRLNQWILEQADPAKRAELAAKRSQGEIEKRIAKAEEDNRKLREELAAKDRAREEGAARSSAHQAFASRVAQVKEHAPLAARVLEKRPQRALQRCDEIADTLSAKGVAFNFDDVIVTYERELADEAAVYRDDPQQPGSTTATSQGQQTSPHNAAAKATPVTNRAAATRTSITDDDEADLPFEERVRRTERRARSLR